MTDEYLERYLRHAPKHHFYATAENDIFRDEGLIMYHRLADLNAGIDRSSGGVVEGVDFEVFDMVPNFFFLFAKFYNTVPRPVQILW